MTTIMANMGGDSDTHKKGIEGYITDATGYPARVGKLNGVTFFPSMGFDFESLEVRSPGDFELVASAQRVKLVLGFWDMIFKTGKFKDVYIEDLQIEAGTIGRHALKIQKLGVVANKKGEPTLYAQGVIGAYDLMFDLSLESVGTRYKPVYRFPDERGFDLVLGDARFQGVFNEGEDSVSLSELAVSMNEQPVLNGEMKIYALSELGARLSGIFDFSEHGSHVEGHINMSFGKLAHSLYGTIETQEINDRDFKSDTQLAGLLRHIMLIASHDNAFSFPLENLELTFPENTVVHKDVQITITPGKERALEFDVEAMRVP